MSMSEEQLQKTGILKMMLDRADHVDETTLLERIDIFEDRLDYLNIDEDRKEKIRDLVKQIKVEEDEKVQEFLFKQLIKTIEDE